MELEKLPVNQELTTEEKIYIYEETLQKCSFDSETDLKDIPLLSKDEEIEFAKKIEQGHEEYKEYFLLANLRLVAKKALYYYHPTSRYHNLEKKDLFQDGTIGLMKAIEKFDYKRGYKFSTYASWWIENKISRSIEESGHMIRQPVSFIEKTLNFKKKRNELFEELQREPTIEEIAEKIGITVEKAKLLREKADLSIVSINKPIKNEEEIYWGELIEDKTFEKPEDIVLKEAYFEEIKKIIETLDAREKEIIKLRFGLGNGNEYKSLHFVGKKFGLTRERIRQIEVGILRKIQVALIQQSPEISQEVFQSFSQKDQQVLELRFGLKNIKSESKKATSKITGVSKEKVDEIENKYIKKITEYYTGYTS